MTTERPIEPNHLQSDEDQHDAQSVLEHVELVDSAPEQEIKVAQSQDGENVRSKDNQGFSREGKNGGYGVNSKDDVGQLQKKQRNKKRCRVQTPLSGRYQEEPLTLELGRHRHKSAKKLDDGVF